MTNLTLDQETTATIFRDAFLKAIPQKDRDEIFAKAIGDLLKVEQSRGFGREDNWLAQIMRDVARAQLATSIRDYCAQPEQRAKIEAAVKAVCDKVLDAMPGVIGEVTAKVLERAVYAAANERDR